jgi:hypothetical protein
MGFNKCIISLRHITYIIKEYGEMHLVNLYKKCDCLIGESDGIELLNTIMEKYNESHTRGGSDNQIPLQPSED